MQRELVDPSPLLSEQGALMQVGWSRQPILDCNLERAHFYRLRWLQRFRVKRWDYYGVTTPGLYFSATLAHLGYAGLVFAYVVDFGQRRYHEETLLVPLGRGIHLARNSDAGASRFDNGRVRLEFLVEAQGRRIVLDWPEFEDGQRLAADLWLRPKPDHESVVVVIPIGEQRFYYNRKVNCLPAEGWIEHSGRRTQVRPADGLGNLDWGRGVWEYSSFWVWASASGFLPDGRTLGLNLGFGFGDTSQATENAVILEGRVHKLADIRFTYDPTDFMRPWQMLSPDGRLDLEFVPFIERVAKSNVVLVRSEVHQLFGRYRGHVVTDAGEMIRVDDLIGFAEEHHARW